jgi:hypothetical protein
VFSHIERRDGGDGGGRSMQSEKPPQCFNCDQPMSFSLRISLPPQFVYRCEACKVEAWVPERQPLVAPAPPPPSPHGQQQQQAQREVKNSDSDGTG